MFQDTSLSKDLNDNFKSHIAATTPLQGEMHQCTNSTVGTLIEAHLHLWYYSNKTTNVIQTMHFASQLLVVWITIKFILL